MGTSATPSPRLTVTVLGALSLSVDGHERPFPAGRPGRLLVALLLARGRVVGADHLVEVVWDEEPPEDPRAALHTTVNRVRRALGPSAVLLVHRAPGYQLLRDGVVVDAERFTEAAARARSTGTVDVLDQALRMWGGPPWAEHALDLAAAEARRLHEVWFGLREDRAAAMLATSALGTPATDDAIGELRLLTAESLRERPVALLMRALHAAGDVAQALAAYDGHRLRLAEELGLDPSPELAELHRQVLGRTLAPPQPPAPRPGRVQAPVVRLHGRDTQLASITSMISQHRCVTVVGPGGVGKTSVAAAVCQAGPPGHDAGPMWWLDLARISDPAALRPAVADALDAPVFPGSDTQDALRRRLEDARGLLVLDNCEHLLGACADLVAEVLDHGDRLRVLSTSRERLGLPEEHVFPLPPLQLPPDDDPGDDPDDDPGDDVDVEPAAAVQLFLERARAVAPELSSDRETLRRVAALVRTLDGLPLAIELAAGRLGSVTLDDLRSELGSRLDLLRSGSRRTHARHRTLSATVRWSYELLDPESQTAFRALSTFEGPFDLPAAEAVIGPHAAVVVADLVEKSLVVRPGLTGRGRYRLLETLRAFARGLVTDEEGAELRRRHARWAAQLALRADLGVRSADEARWAEALEQALPDLAAAVRWSLSDGDPRTSAAIVGALQRWAYFRVRPDVLGWAHDVLATGADTPDVRVAATSHCWMTGRFAEARAHALAGVAAAGGHGHPAAGPCFEALGDVALAMGDLQEAFTAYASACRLAEENQQVDAAALRACGMALARTYAGSPADDELILMRSLTARAESPTTLAMTAYVEGEAAADRAPYLALAHLRRAVDLGTSVGNRLVVGVAMSAHTAVVSRSGTLDGATVDAASTAIAHWKGSGNLNLFVTCLRNVVPLLGRLSEHRAVVELAAALEAAGSAHASYGEEARRMAECVAVARSVLGDAFEEAWVAGQGRSLTQSADAALRALAVARTRLVG